MGTNSRQTAAGGLEFIDDVTASKVYEIGGQNFRNMKIRKISMPGVVATTGGALLAWLNPENVAIIVDRVEIDVGTKSTGAANVSVGKSADAVTSAATFIDTYAIGAAEKVVNNIDDKGAGGKSVQKIPVGGYITATGSADTTGLVSTVYIHYYLTA